MIGPCLKEARITKQSFCFAIFASVLSENTHLILAETGPFTELAHKTGIFNKIRNLLKIHLILATECMCNKLLKFNVYHLGYRNIHGR